MIHKVITQLLGWEDMEAVNKITGLGAFTTDNWCNISVFEEAPELKKYVNTEDYAALKDGKADYIAFRVDE